MRVMSIGGNCADLAFLAPDVRVPGPVDNWYAIHGMKSIIGLFTNFKEQLAEGWSRKEWNWHYFRDYSCAHIDIEDPEVVEKVLKRYATFLEFWDKVKSDSDCYFSYVLNPDDVCKKGNKNVLVDTTLDMLKKIDEYFPLCKLIVVGTPFVKLKSGWFHSFIDEIPAGINYVDVVDVNNLSIQPKNVKEKTGSIEQFNRYLSALKTGKTIPLTMPRKKPSPPKLTPSKSTKKPAPKRTEFHEDYWDE